MKPDAHAHVLKEMNERIVKSFIDFLILSKLRSGPMSGYDFVTFINKKFYMLISPGKIYHTLLLMERDGFIESTGNQKKRVYLLTDKGEETVRTIYNLKEKILGMVIDLFMS